MTESKSNSDLIESNNSAIAGMKRFSHEAMATTFEVIIVHDDEKYARQAAAAAFDQVNRLEAELSRFIENSDISRINNLPANQPLVLGMFYTCRDGNSSISYQSNPGDRNLSSRGSNTAPNSGSHPGRVDQGRGTRLGCANRIRAGLGRTISCGPHPACETV